MLALLACQLAGSIRWRTSPMTTQSILFGYHENGTVNKKEAAIVRMIFYIYVVCELSHERIAFHLKRLGIACPGDSWTDLLVYEILTNPVYIGQGLPDILQLEIILFDRYGTKAQIRAVLLAASNSIPKLLSDSNKRFMKKSAPDS
jgi:hypothetical protein